MGPDERQQVQSSDSESMSLRSLNLESIGFGLAVTWFGLLLWSPATIPDHLLSQGADLQVHILRGILLAVVACVYLLVQLVPAVILNKTIKTAGLFVAVALSPLPILGNLVTEMTSLYEAVPLLIYINWGFAGFSSAAIMLIWGYDMSTKQSRYQGVINVSMGHVCCGGIFVLFQFLQPGAALVLTIAMPFVLLIIWIVEKRNAKEYEQDDSEHTSYPVALSDVRMVLGRGSNLFVFSYGFIMGIAGAIATQFAFTEIINYVIGLPTLLAGVLMYFVVKKKLFKNGRLLMVAFLPFLVSSLFILSVVNDVGKLVCLSLVFFVIQCYNVMNTAFIGGGSSTKELRRNYDFFNCESRTADMMGSTLGWATAIVIQFFIDPIRTPEAYFLIAAIFVVITIIVNNQFDKAMPKDMGKHRGVQGTVKLIEWEEACQRVSAKYKLSTREREVFLLLSRGRDRQYIHTKLYISPSTVRTHTYNIYQKASIHNQQQLIDLVEMELASSDED